MTGDYALIEDGMVRNVIVADADFCAAYVAAEDNTYQHYVFVDDIDPHPGIGWSYDSASGVFTAPPPPPVDPAVEAAREQRAADQALADSLLASRNRTALQTQHLIDALARLAGVEPGDV